MNILSIRVVVGLCNSGSSGNAWQYIVVKVGVYELLGFRVSA